MNDIRFFLQVDYPQTDTGGVIEESNIDFYTITNPEIYKYRYDGDVYILISGYLKVHDDTQPFRVYIVHFLGTDERYNLFFNKLIGACIIGVAVTPNLMTYPYSSCEFPTIKDSTRFIIPLPMDTRIDYIKEMANMRGETTEPDGV